MRPDPRLAAAVVAALAAVAVPTSWLVGDGGSAEQMLDLGAVTWRLSWASVALFLWGASRAPEPDVPPRSLFGALADRGAVGVLIVATLVRVIRLDAPLWFDEIWMHRDWLSLSFGDLLRTYGSDNNHPLYSTLAWLSVAVFGDSPAALRLPALVFGVGSVAALYVLSRDRVGKPEATLAALLLALAHPHVGFSQEARGYTGLLFFGLVSTHAFLTALETGRSRAWLVHGAALALSVLTHMTGAFLAFGHLALVAWRWRREGLDAGVRAGLRGLLFGTLLAAALHGLLLPQIVWFFVLRRVPEVAGESSWKDPLWLLEEVARVAGLPTGLTGLAVAVCGLAGLAGLVMLWRRQAWIAVLVIVPSVVLAAAMAGLGRNLWPRLFFFAAGYAVLALVVVVYDLARRAGERFTPERPTLPRQVAAGVLLLGALVTLPRALALPKQDFPGARDYVLGVAQEGEAIVTVGLARVPYEHYYAAPFVPVADVAGLRAAIPLGRTGYVLHTFPIFLASRMPELAEELHRRGHEVARFRGSKGDGDVVVYRIG